VDRLDGHQGALIATSRKRASRLTNQFSLSSLLVIFRWPEPGVPAGDAEVRALVAGLVGDRRLWTFEADGQGGSHP